MNNFLKINLFWVTFLYFSNTLSANIIYVNLNANAVCNDGTSWFCAYTDLQSALETAQLNDSIWVAAGTYYPTNSDDRTISFVLPQGIALLGGFLGIETTIQQRDYEANPTILSGEIGIFMNQTDNSLHILTAKNLGEISIIDGLFFEFGAALSAPLGEIEEYGGAIYHTVDSLNIESNLTIQNCHFNNNRGTHGACIATIGIKGNANTTIQNCNFLENTGLGAVHSAESRNIESKLLIDLENIIIDDNNLNLSLPSLTVLTIVENIGIKGQIDFNMNNCDLDNNRGAIGGIQDSALVNVQVRNSRILNSKRTAFYNENNFGNLTFTVDSCLFSGSQSFIFWFKHQDANITKIKINNSEFTENKNPIFSINELESFLTTLLDTLDIEFTNNLIQENSINGNGPFITGMVNANYNTILVDSCEFIGNTYGTTSGTGYIMDFAAFRKIYVKIKNTNFRDNFSVNAGIILAFESDEFESDLLILEKCNFIDNIQLDGGNAVGTASILKTAGTDLRIENCNFINNYTEERTIICLGNRNPPSIQPVNAQIINCNFQNNETNSGVSCFEIFDSNVDFLNCQFANNKANNIFGGTVTGGLRIDNSIVNLANCNFYNNQGDISSGAIFDKNSLITANNSIFYQNTGMMSVQENSNNYPNFFNNCLIQDNACLDFNTTCTNSLFATDPLFTHADSSDFTLQPCSPAINFGNNVWLDSFDISTDLAGNPRIISDIVDAGAYESGADLIFAVDSLRPFMCADSLGGSVAFLVEKGCAPYTLMWAADTLSGLLATELSVTDLAAGSYTFILIDARGNSVEQMVEIPAQPDFTLATQQADYNCETETGGSIFASASNPNLTYDYLWNTGDTSFIIGNLLPDIYTVTVTDNQGCSATRSVAIHPSGLMPLSISVSPISCHDSADGTAAVAPLVGIAPYTYAWASGETDSLITNLSGGMYEVTVSDAISCTNVLEFSMLPPDSLTIDILATDVQCAGLANGAISASAMGGTPEYAYLWNTAQTMPNLTDLSAGTYSVTVTDEKDCMNSLSITIEEPLPLELTLQSTDADCFGAANGTASVQPTGGTAPYQYFWTTGATDSLITNLSAGIYETTITDAQNCTATADISIMQPDSFDFLQNIIPASAFNAADGSIQISDISGGTPPYFTQWNTSETGLLIDNLLPDTYTLTIIDNTGCQQVFTFVVSFMNAIQGSEALFSTINIFPNPLLTNENLVVNFDLKKSIDLTFKIVTADGKVLNEKTEKMKIGNQSILLKMPEVSGVYFLEIMEGAQLLGSWKVVLN